MGAKLQNIIDASTFILLWIVQRFVFKTGYKVVTAFNT